VANENVKVARGYHERTKHSEERLRANPHHLDWDNQPVPFKLYRDLEPIPLPRQLEPGTVSALRAISASVARETEPIEQVRGLQALARVLYYSAGITKVRRSPGGDVYFRAASNTGALYHVDFYLACRDLPDLRCLRERSTTRRSARSTARRASSTGRRSDAGAAWSFRVRNQIP
jgi:hypothetical protein